MKASETKNPAMFHWTAVHPDKFCRDTPPQVASGNGGIWEESMMWQDPIHAF